MGRRRADRPRELPTRERRHRSPRDSVRSAAGWVVERTLASRSPVDGYLDSAATRFDDRDRAFLQELVLGTLRWLTRLDHVIGEASHRPFSRIEAPLHAPLRIAAYQLLLLDRVPPHAIVHEAVDQARCLTHRGGASFVNAVLRKIARSPSLASWPVDEADPVRRLAVEMSHPEFLVRRWVERFGAARTERLLRANNRPRPLQLLAFRDRGGRELLAESLIDEGIEVVPSRYSRLGLTLRRGTPFAAESFARGDFYVQDEIGQVSALFPPPQPGERILDAAAAPGGKSLAILAFEPEAKPVLADSSPSRLVRLRENLRRLGRPLPVVATDATSSALGATFSRVIADLPCSGTGTLRKNPEIKWRLSEEEVDRLADQGTRMLVALADRVEPGGLLVAITCSLESEENEFAVDRLLATRPELEPLELSGCLEPPLDTGIEAPGRWRFLPGEDHDGFTVHVLRRSGAKSIVSPGGNARSAC